MKFLKWAAVALLTVALPMTAAAQSDSGRVTGTVLDQTGAFVTGASVTVKNQKTGETRTATTGDNGYFVVASLKPSTYTITVQKTGFANVEYTDMPVAVGQELTLDFEFKPAAAQEDGHGHRQLARDRHQLRADRRQRQRARSAGPAGQRPADVAADAAGARLAERRHRHLAGHPLLRPRRRAERHQVRRHRGLRRSSTRRRAWPTARTRRPSSCRRASRTSRSSASSRAATRPSSAPAPADRSASSPSRAATHLHGSLFEYLRNDRFDAANYFDSQRNADGSIIAEAGSAPTVPKSPLKQNQFGGSVGGPIVEGSGVLLRQLRRLPADRGQELHRGRAERIGVGARRSGDRSPATRVHRARRAHPAGRVDQSGLRHLSGAVDAGSHARTPSAAPGLQDQRQLVVVRARVPRPGRELQSARTSAAGDST